VPIALGIPPLAELLARLLPKIIQLIQMYRHADRRVAEKLLEFQDHTQKLQLYLEEFREPSPDLPTNIKEHLGRLFVVLRGKLSASELEVNDFLGSHKLLGIKVVMSSVEKIVVDVQKWQQRVEDHFELLNRWPKPFKDPRAGNNKTAVGRVRLVNEAIFAATESTPEGLDLTSKTLLKI
jgi:hypothetical protein